MLDYGLTGNRSQLIILHSLKFIEHRSGLSKRPRDTLALIFGLLLRPRSGVLGNSHSIRNGKIAGKR